MKNFFPNAIIILISATAAAQESLITCSVSNQTAQVIDNAIVIVGEKLDVPVETLIVSLPGLSQPAVRLDGKEIRVKYYAGNDFEKYAFLQMSIDRINSTIYDVKPSLYSLAFEGLQFQCLVSANKK